MNWPLGLNFLLIAGLAMALGVGCDRTETSGTDKPRGRTSVADAATAPATTPATRPAIPMTIGGEVFNFPAAKLRLAGKDGAITADLYSDDPKEAIEDNYTGNSFYLVMPLEGDDPQTLGEATWVYKAASGTARSETTTGIFLYGTKYRLQPLVVSVDILCAGPTARVIIRGQFLRFDTKQDGLPTPVSVSADIRATIEYKER